MNEKPVKHQWLLEIRNKMPEPLRFKAKVLAPKPHPDDAFETEEGYLAEPELFIGAGSTRSFRLYLDQKKAARLGIKISHLQIDQAGGPVALPCRH